LTNSPRDIRTFAWKDNETILYVAQEKKTKLETELKEKKDTSQVVEDEPTSRRFACGASISRKRRASASATTRTAPSRSRSPRMAAGRSRSTSAASVTRSTTKSSRRSTSAIWEKKHRKQVFVGNFNIAKVYWQNDSNGFFAINQFTHHKDFLMAYIEELHHFNVADSKVTRVGFAMAARPGRQRRGIRRRTRRLHCASGRRRAPCGSALHQEGQWLGADNARCEERTACLCKQGWQDACFHALDGNESAALVAAALDGASLKNVTELVDLHADLRKKPMAKTEVFRWQGALNEQVEGLVSYPHNYEEGKKYPLIVLIHGGPHSADFDQWDERWAYVRNLLSARSAIIFKPNYHGSSH